VEDKSESDPDGEGFLENYELPDPDSSEWGAVATVDEGRDE